MLKNNCCRWILSIEEFKIYSEQPFSKITLSVQALTHQLFQLLIIQKDGTILVLLATPQGYVLYNYLQSKNSKIFLREHHNFNKSIWK